MSEIKNDLQGKWLKNKRSGNVFFITDIFTGYPVEYDFQPTLTFHIKAFGKQVYRYITVHDLNKYDILEKDAYD